ncbi:MAG: DUF1398 family protein [Proteobacteria bacterium]|nr:DUF1398 family protein [Pseudomonadota bacterium]
MNIDVINRGRKMCLADTMSFLEFVKTLIDVGMERYTVDFVSLKAAYYSINNEVYITDFEFEKLPISLQFDQASVKEAVLASREGRMKYKDFLPYIANAGCCRYEVFITGKKVIYFGRDGSTHIELFPENRQS